MQKKKKEEKSLDSYKHFFQFCFNSYFAVIIGKGIKCRETIVYKKKKLLLTNLGSKKKIQKEKRILLSAVFSYPLLLCLTKIKI